MTPPPPPPAASPPPPPPPATHLLILRSRPAPQTVGHRPSQDDPRPAPDGSVPPQPPADGSRPFRPSRSARWLARTTLRRETPALRAAFLARESRRAADDQILADYEAASLAPAATSVLVATPVPA